MTEEMQQYQEPQPYPTYEATAEEAAMAAERQVERNRYAAYVKDMVDKGNRALAFGAWQRLVALEDALPATRKYEADRIAAEVAAEPKDGRSYAERVAAATEHYADQPSDRLPVRRG